MNGPYSGAGLRPMADASQDLDRLCRFELNRTHWPPFPANYRVILVSFLAYLRWNRSSSTSSPIPGVSATV